MALETFNPSIRPSPGGSRSPEVNLITSGFGDGYSLDMPNGLNHIRAVVSLKWDALTEAQIQELRQFFEDQGGYKAFWYQPHSYAAPLKWTCKEWSDDGTAPFSFSAKLRQSFTLEV